MATNKVDAFGKNLIDLTSDTVTESDLPQGVTAHNAAGEVITGTNPMEYAPQKKRKFTETTNAGWWRIGVIKDNIHYSFLLSLSTGWWDTGGTTWGVVVSKNFDFRNSSKLCNITQFFDDSKTHADASKIRIVIDPSEHSYEYVDIYREKASVHDPWNISVIEIDGPTLFDFLSEPIYNPEIEEGKIVKEFQLTMNGGMISDRAVADRLGNKIDEMYAKKTELTVRTMKWNRVTTEEELDSLISTTINSIPDDSTFEFCVGLGVGNMILSGGGTWHITGFRSGEKYAFIEAKSYTAGNGQIRHYTRNLINGEWTSWYHVNYS